MNEQTLKHLQEAFGEMPLNIKFKKLDPRAVIPSYAHNGDVGMDMTAIDIEYDEEKDLYIYHTGLAFESDFHYGQFLFPRSSNRKTDAYLCNSVGIADSAIYRGEILFCYKNRDSIETLSIREATKEYMKYITECCHDKDFSLITAVALFNETVHQIKNQAKELAFAPYKVGDKIGQMVFIPYPEVNLIEVDELSTSERGANGFGSTGN